MGLDKSVSGPFDALIVNASVTLGGQPEGLTP